MPGEVSSDLNTEQVLSQKTIEPFRGADVDKYDALSLQSTARLCSSALKTLKTPSSLSSVSSLSSLAMKHRRLVCLFHGQCLVPSPRSQRGDTEQNISMK